MTDLFDVGPPHGDARSAPRTRRDRKEEQERTNRRRVRRSRTVISVLVSLVLIGGAAYLALPAIRDMFSGGPPPPDYAGPGAGSVMIEVPAGSSGAAIAALLYEADVVASEKAFVNAFNEDPNATSIQAGFYNLQLQMPAAEAMAALHDRENRAEVSITVPEGTRAASVYERISAATGIPVEDVQAAAGDTASFGLPEEAGGNVEGWLGAQTYILPPTADARVILSAMVQETIGTLESLNIPNEEWQDSLIKASIAQREGQPEDFGMVVRVIMNRADPSNPETVGMLGMDSTVIYGLGADGVLLTNEQKAIDTPFNTFMHPGLPPTPICTPSVEAIAATVDPPEGPWNYFVTVNLDTGETKFAATYVEFQTYVQEWRDWLAANPDAHPGTAETPGMAPAEEP
ncbi:MAG TPA: endolytic transglycosylase MltG [Actinomycetaceae bacterium]|nr:endolytic transglycosylase MltG [Actinomycetaceae bacterium]